MARRRNNIMLGCLLLCVAAMCHAVWIGRIGGQELPFTTLVNSDQVSAFDTVEEPECLVFVDRQDADTFIAERNSSIPDSAIAALTQADYQNAVVIIVTYGSERVSQSLDVQRVVRTGSRVVMLAKFVGYPPFGGRPTVITNPFQIIAVPKESLRGAAIHFKLTNGWYPAAESTHAVP